MRTGMEAGASACVNVLTRADSGTVNDMTEPWVDEGRTLG